MFTIEYGQIEPSLSNARTLQHLKLQNLVAAGVVRPELLVNPNDWSSVFRDRQELIEIPNAYFGAFVDGKLNGYIKTEMWDIVDERLFTLESTPSLLVEINPSGMIPTPRQKLGIFGLVVNAKLTVEQQQEIAERFLYTATDFALHQELDEVNISFHEKDPVQPIAKEQDYKFTGRIGQVATLPHVLQRLYTKPLDT